MGHLETLPQEEAALPQHAHLQPNPAGMDSALDLFSDSLSEDED